MSDTDSFEMIADDAADVFSLDDESSTSGKSNSGSGSDNGSSSSCQSWTRVDTPLENNGREHQEKVNDDGGGSGRGQQEQEQHQQQQQQQQGHRETAAGRENDDDNERGNAVPSNVTVSIAAAAAAAAGAAGAVVVGGSEGGARSVGSFGPMEQEAPVVAAAADGREEGRARGAVDLQNYASSERRSSGEDDGSGAEQQLQQQRGLVNRFEAMALDEGDVDLEPLPLDRVWDAGWDAFGNPSIVADRHRRGGGGGIDDSQGGSFQGISTGAALSDGEPSYEYSSGGDDAPAVVADNRSVWDYDDDDDEEEEDAGTFLPATLPRTTSRGDDLLPMAENNNVQWRRMEENTWGGVGIGAAYAAADPGRSQGPVFLDWSSSSWRSGSGQQPATTTTRTSSSSTSATAAAALFSDDRRRQQQQHPPWPQKGHARIRDLSSWRRGQQPATTTRTSSSSSAGRGSSPFPEPAPRFPQRQHTPWDQPSTAFHQPSAAAVFRQPAPLHQPSAHFDQPTHFHQPVPSAVSAVSTISNRAGARGNGGARRFLTERSVTPPSGDNKRRANAAAWDAHAAPEMNLAGFFEGIGDDDDSEENVVAEPAENPQAEAPPAPASMPSNGNALEGISEEDQLRMAVEASLEESGAGAAMSNGDKAFAQVWDDAPNLALTFRAPRDLAFRGIFEDALAAAGDGERLLLVNLQSPGCFGSHAINRDVWSDDVLRNVISARFVFWQCTPDEWEGRRYAEHFGVNAFPHVAVIHPARRRVLWGREGWTPSRPWSGAEMVQHLTDLCFDDQKRCQEGQDQGQAIENDVAMEEEEEDDDDDDDPKFVGKALADVQKEYECQKYLLGGEDANMEPEEMIALQEALLLQSH